MQDHLSDSGFGAAVRQRRAELGLRLDQLAQSSGVSAAALSRLERGLLEPSLRNALAIAKGLGCELAELVHVPAAEIIRNGENLRFFDLSTGIERLTLARPSASLELLLYAVPAGTRSARFAAHKPGTREVFHLLSGRLIIHVDARSIPLAAGDTATLRMDCEHWFEAAGDEEARFILLITGINPAA